ncbi:beta-propeller fold lactonase family protein [Nostocoides sp. F2B08]|uniref:lactonase family protein n=1 Tax=Nostocoides sp. F2B08 TaxID=2653936 RepID=UPI0012634F69|nr:beta-propeller fold lactonase family protein [Tetrasphaera sp. F2B08]KAB7745310.1 beta-propeller fold lactonase family protein [Tetrasphaera sp. F2B08]
MSELLLIANAGDGTISTLRLHREPRPRLEVLATSGDLPDCGTFAIDADRDLVYAAYKGDPPGICTLRLDRESGALSEVSRTAVTDSLTYLFLAAGGRALLGASYGGGFGAVWPVEGGRLGEPHSRFEYKNLHSIVADRDRVYAVALGDDLLAQFELDQDGRLSPLDPPTVVAPKGCGPRHLIVDGSNAYVMTEFSGRAIRYDVDSRGRLTEAEAVDAVDPTAGLEHSELGADPQEEPLIWGADVHRARDFLITSERNSSRLTVIRLNERGRLGDIVGYVDTEAVPRGFGVSHDGRFVVAVGEESTFAQLLELDDDGRLEQLDRVQIGEGANWVRWV